MDIKALFAILLVAGIVGGFSINNYLIEKNTADMETETLEDDKLEKVEVGNEAPDFTITDTEGNEFNLSDYEGEKVIGHGFGVLFQAIFLLIFDTYFGFKVLKSKE